MCLRPLILADADAPPFPRSTAPRSPLTVFLFPNRRRGMQHSERGDFIKRHAQTRTSRTSFTIADFCSRLRLRSLAASPLDYHVQFIVDIGIGETLRKMLTNDGNRERQVSPRQPAEYSENVPEGRKKGK
jgi:hypothetical protein